MKETKRKPGAPTKPGSLYRIQIRCSEKMYNSIRSMYDRIDVKERATIFYDALKDYLKKENKNER